MPLFVIFKILTYEEIGDTRAANEACKFLREILERFPQRKADILEKLMQIFPSIIGRETLRHLVWIFGEYCTTYEEINSFMTLIRQVSLTRYNALKSFIFWNSSNFFHYSIIFVESNREKVS